MVTAILQFNGTLFKKLNSEGHSGWDGAKAGYHFITYNENDSGFVNFSNCDYGPARSFYGKRHNNSFKLFLIY